ncbi:MAG: hypothetical protein K6A62_04085 [Bacteroidales bacterium]|nr:hypothetical protein [Bacteroidales bacterium]
MKKIIISIIIILLFSPILCAQKNLYKDGYRGMIELGTYSFRQGEALGMIQFSTIHGYGFGAGLFIGAGVGYTHEIMSELQGGNVFLDVKYNLKNTSISPFIEGRAGYRFMLNSDPEEIGGQCIAIAGGVDFGRFSARVGYEHGAFRHKVWKDWVYNTLYSRSDQLFFSLAFNF